MTLFAVVLGPPCAYWDVLCDFMHDSFSWLCSEQRDVISPLQQPPGVMIHIIAYGIEHLMPGGIGATQSCPYRLQGDCWLGGNTFRTIPLSQNLSPPDGPVLLWIMLSCLCCE